MNDPAVLQISPSIGHVPLPLPRVLRIAEEYEAAGRYDDAEELLRTVLDSIPQQPDALHLLGVVLFRRGRLQEAARLMEEAIARHRDTPLYYRNICTVYEQLGRLDEGIAAGRRAVELAPYDAEVHHNLAVVHQRLLHLDEAIACARRAIALAPSLPAPHLALAEALLLRGDFAAGWQEYEWRFQGAGADDFLPGAGRREWDGTPGSEPLLLIADQGFGDAILFAR